ncbi:H-NS family nucleoid-associated regulatory protein [Pseudooceanicola sp. 200-1SW]|uniref:H-NS histone family protein n=1 Tax=Pseudooceanicola sp. 200-1SW TaxID=3425949 RepID=UPI003D800134
MTQHRDIDLSSLSLAELRKLERRVARAISTFEGRRIADARAILAARAHDLGYTLDELTSESVKQRAKLPPKYQHPEDASLTWTGKGRKPKWLHDALAAGLELEALSI